MRYCEGQDVSVESHNIERYSCRPEFLETFISMKSSSWSNFLHNLWFLLKCLTTDKKSFIYKHYTWDNTLPYPIRNKEDRYLCTRNSLINRKGTTEWRVWSVSEDNANILEDEWLSEYTVSTSLVIIVFNVLTFDILIHYTGHSGSVQYICSVYIHINCLIIIIVLFHFHIQVFSMVSLPHVSYGTFLRKRGRL